MFCGYCLVCWTSQLFAFTLHNTHFCPWQLFSTGCKSCPSLKYTSAQSVVILPLVFVFQWSKSRAPRENQANKVDNSLWEAKKWEITRICFLWKKCKCISQWCRSKEEAERQCYKKKKKSVLIECAQKNHCCFSCWYHLGDRWYSPCPGGNDWLRRNAVHSLCSQ